MNQPSLTPVATAVARLASTPADQRLALVADLLPDLRALVAGGNVGPQSMAGLLTKAARAIDPRSPHLADPAAALQRLETLTAAARSTPARGRGRPEIGPDTKVALHLHTYAWLDDLAREWGLLRGGEPNRSATIRRIVEERQHDDSR